MSDYVRGEYDGYKMPPPFTGEMTPEILAEKEAARREAEKFAKELREKYGISKQR